ncbi:MAG: M16 family metallopeptidase, partial [bacterium]
RMCYGVFRGPAFTRRGLFFLLLFIVAVFVSAADMPAGPTGTYKDYEGRVVEFTLSNGLKVIVLHRDHAPVFTFQIKADVGGVDETVGQTGLAHLFEHMAFKGSCAIGTTDCQKEKKALEVMEATYTQYRAYLLKQNAGMPLSDADKTQMDALWKKFKEQEADAQLNVVQNEFGQYISEAGGTGLNASTGDDSTQYFYSLPANKLELWGWLESERFSDPVLREFYKERDVVMEERRLRTESTPFGRLILEYYGAAFLAHPYGRPVIGWRSDVTTLTITQAQEFFNKYYGARNLVCVVVGDIDPMDVKRVAEKYLSRIPSGEDPAPVSTVEPPQNGERRVTLEDVGQPLLYIGWHTPQIDHPDTQPLEALATMLGGGRTSRLYKRLVKRDRIATTAFASNGAQKYPGLFEISATPVRGKTAEDVEPVIYDEINKLLTTDPPTEDELKKYKTGAQAGFIRGLNSDAGMASQLAYYQFYLGSWREMFREPDRIDGVTLDDVKRVAAHYLTKKSRTVGLIKTVQPAGSTGGKPQ